MKKMKQFYFAVTAAMLMLFATSMNTYAAYPEAVWEVTGFAGFTDSTLSTIMDKFVGSKLYTVEDKVISNSETGKTVTAITLVSENADDSPVNIGKCDKYLAGTGKDAGFCWISDTMMVIPIKADESMAGLLDEVEFMTCGKLQDGLEGVPEEDITVDDTESAADPAGTTTDSASTESDQKETEAQESDDADQGPQYGEVTDPLYYETEDGIIEYVSYEYANPGFVVDDEGKFGQILIVNYEFTNNTDKPCLYNNCFSPKAYQNGQEIMFPPVGVAVTLNSEYVPEYYDNQLSTVLPGYSITVGISYELKDMSPVTIIAERTNRFDEISKPMTIYLEEKTAETTDEERVDSADAGAAPFEVDASAADESAPFNVDASAAEDNSTSPAANTASYAPEIPDQTPYAGIKAQMVDHSWYFNGGDNYTLGALTFRDNAAYIETMKYDGNGKHPGNSAEVFYYLTDTDVVIYDNEKEIEKIPYFLEGDLLHLSYGKFLTPAQVHEDLKGYWTYQTRETEYNILIQDAYIEYECATKSLLRDYDYFYYGPYSGMYLMNFGGFETEMFNGNDFFYNVINGKGTLLHYNHVCSPGNGFKGEQGYSF